MYTIFLDLNKIFGTMGHEIILAKKTKLQYNTEQLIAGLILLKRL